MNLPEVFPSLAGSARLVALVWSPLHSSFMAWPLYSFRLRYGTSEYDMMFDGLTRLCWLWLADDFFFYFVLVLVLGRGCGTVYCMLMSVSCRILSLPPSLFVSFGAPFFL